jgi:DNA-binding NarL/FixJ family response regulator
MQDIYLVEDSGVVRQRLEALLADVPKTRVVGHASGAREAISDILAKQPDIVLCDLTSSRARGSTCCAP